MITSIRLQNFKAHRDTTVPLGRFTVLVGPNGAGKTSVLEALAISNRLVLEAPEDVFSGDHGPAYLRRSQRDGPLVLALEINQRGSAWCIAFEVKTFRYDERVWQYNFVWQSGVNSQRRSFNRSAPIRDTNPEIFAFLGTAGLHKFNARDIAAVAYRSSAESAVFCDGNNTAVALAAIKLESDEDFARIEAELRSLIPDLERIRIRPTALHGHAQHQGAGQELVGSEILFDFRNAPNVPFHAASEGMLIALAILTVLYGPNRPNLLLLDAFDQSLHPRAQIELVRLLKRLLEAFPDVQIVATTHSPYVLDGLSPEDVVVFALRADGTVATKRLSEHPQAAKMKDALSAGQLWSLDPEADWVPGEATAAR
jgi:predicted ATPase